jgi:hypothetical protein
LGSLYPSIIELKELKSALGRERVEKFYPSVGDLTPVVQSVVDD